MSAFISRERGSLCFFDGARNSASSLVADLTIPKNVRISLLQAV